MHELKLMDIQKKYKDKEAVRKFNYTFTNGVYGLLGENGAGKTTLMRLICGVLQPTRGSIYCDNIEIDSMGTEYRRLLGYLPQDYLEVPVQFLFFVSYLLKKSSAFSFSHFLTLPYLKVRQYDYRHSLPVALSMPPYIAGSILQ